MFWLSILLYYHKTQWVGSYQHLNNFIIWNSPINSVPYTDKLQHFLGKLTVTQDCSSITAARWRNKSYCLWISLSLIWRPHNSERSMIPKLTIFVTSRLPSVNLPQRHGPQHSTPSGVIRTHKPRIITHIKLITLQCLNMLHHAHYCIQHDGHYSEYDYASGITQQAMLLLTVVC